jgi:hypothetical protein
VQTRVADYERRRKRRKVPEKCRNGTVRRYLGVFKLLLTQSQGYDHGTDGERPKEIIRRSKDKDSIAADMQIKARSCAAWRASEEGSGRMR